MAERNRPWTKSSTWAAGLFHTIMLDQIATRRFPHKIINYKADLHIDEHHTVEDTATRAPALH